MYGIFTKFILDFLEDISNLPVFLIQKNKTGIKNEGHLSADHRNAINVAHIDQVHSRYISHHKRRSGSDRYIVKIKIVKIKI